MQEIKYVLYARKSTEGDDKQAQSIEAQLYEMRKLAKTKNLKIVEEIQEAKSAKTPFKRPGFNRMIELLESGNASGILTWAVNRISRNPAESGLIQQMLQDEKIKRIQTYNGKYDPDDNAVIFSVESSVSNQFIQDLRKNVKRGIAEKARNGGISGPAPQGYENDRLNKTIRIDKKRFPIIREAFDMFLEGYSIDRIIQAMNEKGYRTLNRKPRGSNPMSRTTLYFIFSNPRYAGKIPDPFEPNVYYDANYPPMITPQEYDKVQELLGRRGRTRFSETHEFTLKGLLKCGECGCMITASKKKKTLKDGTVNEHIYYHCTRKRKCEQRSGYREKDLISMVDDLLNQYEISPQLYSWGMQALDAIAQDEIKNRDNIQMLQFESINDIQSQIDNMITLAAKGMITPEQFEKNSAPLKDELEARQKEQAKSAERSRNWYEFVGKTIETLTNANAQFNTGSLMDKNRILQAIGENPVLIDGNLKLTPHNWVEPIKNGLNEIRTLSDMVRTDNQQIENSSNESIRTIWYPGLDLNQRP
tara:strand:- start:12 stop:1607 length:1596 start_codon:yes stop_codon:yes gene_type:complete